MNNFCFDNIAIRGMAVAVPNDCQRIMEFAPLFPEGDIEKFCKNTGIFQRYVGYRKRIIASDLCVTAANKIFEQFPNIKNEEIDALVFMSQSFDYGGPATSGVIQMRLGLEACGAVYDVTYGCAAFPFGMQIAGSFISSGCRNVLLLIGDSLTAPYANDKDDFLFGDAGCAIVIGQTERREERPVQIRLETIGSKYKMLMEPFRHQRHRFYDLVEDIGIEGANKLPGRIMDGTDVFTFSIKDATAATKTFYKDFNCSADDFDFVAIHQANKMIVDTVAKRIKIPKEKAPISLDRYGNTNGVSVPLTICDYFERIHQYGVKNMLALAFGVGMSIGICNCNINSDICLPIIKSDESYDDGIYPENYL